MSDLLKWAAIVDHSSPQVVAKLLHDQAAELVRLREVCIEQAKQLAMLCVHMPQGSRMLTHTLGVIADLEQAGKEATNGQ